MDRVDREDRSIDALSNRRSGVARYRSAGCVTQRKKKWENDAYHLEGGEVFLPPNELGVLGSHGGDHVVEVHDDVHERVEQAEERRVAAGREAQTEPHAHRHDAVVHHVQNRHLFLLLAQHEEELRGRRENQESSTPAFLQLLYDRKSYRVEEFSELGEVVPPAGVNHLQSAPTASRRGNKIEKSRSLAIRHCDE